MSIHNSKKKLPSKAVEGDSTTEVNNAINFFKMEYPGEGKLFGFLTSSIFGVYFFTK